MTQPFTDGDGNECCPSLIKKADCQRVRHCNYWDRLVFTDEDLKRLKDLLEPFPDQIECAIPTNAGLFRALIARLVAGELCKDHLHAHQCPECVGFVDAWRKAAGK